MYPSLAGEHFEIECINCQWQFDIDSYDVPKSKRAVCPMCGETKNDFSDHTQRSADHPQIIGSSSYQRWDVVAIQQRDSSGNKTIVKRIVGMPGEKVSIRDGDIFSNDIILKKPNDIYCESRQCVFDSSHNIKYGDFSRVIPYEGGIGWKIIDNKKLNFDVDEASQKEKNKQAEKNGATETQWLLFQNIRGYRNTGKRFGPSPIEDSYGFNQNVARHLHRVKDIEVVFNLSCETEAIFKVKIKRGNQAIEFGMDISARTATLADGKNEPATFELTENFDSSDFEIALLNLDGTIYAEVNSVPVFATKSPIQFIPEAGALKILIGAAANSVTINRWQIFRDLYLFGENKPIQLGSDEYFVLGDNPPISVDSRSFGPVKLQNIVGLVK